ncbi:MAG: nicotinate-nucleotide adenylyltransferase [Thermoleophilia bacterium]
MGVLGGTFDPPHIGHVVMACEARWQLVLDEVRLVPARTPPHKLGREIADAEARAAWTEAAVEGRPGLTVSLIELEREGPSYTADTLQAMAGAEPGVRLWFVLGADQLAGVPAWRDPDRILAAARLAVVAREGVDDDDLTDLAERVAPGRHDIVRMPAIGVSSTMIRDRLAAGEPVGHLLPPTVESALVRGGVVPSPRSSDRRKDTSRTRSS